MFYFSVVMGPKKKKDLLTPRVTRNKPKGTKVSEAMPQVMQNDNILDLEDIDNLPSSLPNGVQSTPIQEEVVQDNQDDKRPSKCSSTDSNGPVETLDMPNQEINKQLAQPKPVEPQDNGPLQGPNNMNMTTQETEANEQLAQPQTMDPQIKSPIVEEIIQDLSDDEGSEMLENKVAESLHMQTERLYDLIEELQRVNQTKWLDCKDMKAGIDKLKFMKEQANKVKAHSLDLPEFLERRPMGNQPGYEYIGRLIKAWEEIKGLFGEAKIMVCNLPTSSGDNTKKLNQKVHSASSVVSHLKEKNALKEEELATRAKSIAARSVPKKPSPASSVVSELKEKNARKEQELTKRAKSIAAVREIYGSVNGGAVNKLLGQGSRYIKQKEGREQCPKVILPTQEHGSLDGDLQILDVPQTDRTEAWVNAEKQKSSSHRPKILPRGKTLDEFKEEHPSIQDAIPRNRNFNIKPREPRPDVTILREGELYDDKRSDEIRPEDSVSQQSRKHISRKTTFDRRESFRSGGYRQPRSFAPSPEDDWVCVVTEKHPETDKPLHRGKITSFENLFKNSFQMRYLFNPRANGNTQGSYSRTIIHKFDGNNIEMFRSFEQGVLMKIINDDTLNIDGKFYQLLEYLGGAPLFVVEAYAEKLTITNFVNAIEALYYAYGEPTKFRDALLRQLMNEDPIDLKKPESLLRINALIKRVFRSFGGNTGKDDLLSMSFILEAIKMTPETAYAFHNWLGSNMRTKSLELLQRWLEWMYNQNISELMRRRSVQCFKNPKRQPILNQTLEIMKELPESDNDIQIPPTPKIIEKTEPKAVKIMEEPVLMSTGQAKIMEKRCQLCFGDIHRFSNCRVFMNMTPDQRKIALLIRDGCFRCTGIGHIGSKCMSKMNCQKCQNSEHHESICEASVDSWNAVVNKKWGNSTAQVDSPIPKPRKETEIKKNFLVQGEDLD